MSKPPPLPTPPLHPPPPIYIQDGVVFMHPKSTSQKLKPKNFIFLISLTTMEWVRRSLTPYGRWKVLVFPNGVLYYWAVTHFPKGGICPSQMVWHLKNRKACWSAAQALKPHSEPLIGLFKRPILPKDQINKH